ncbi:hypothetical protein GDO81_006212 [Engystomops pustulosus]|uniref:HIT-type domain-containing protein n=1 Tax=Engystomops pustulosus TaxID=76066 RepID=A0AAV7CWG0_ENGPU|nr:hypothetical protein GDO81_006212 [Engystomops pustulosus]
MGDLCCMCTVETSKYRCPCCRLRYCSLDCSKRHKGKSEELKQLLLNIHLRQLLVTLDETENKDEVLKNYMQEPLFVELADMCLSLINPEEKENILPK